MSGDIEPGELPDLRSRRQMLAGGGTAALGAAALLSGCGTSASPSNIALNKHTPGARRDVRILNGLLALEFQAIAAYTASIPLLAAANRQQHAAHKSSSPAAKTSSTKPQPHAPLTTVPLLASDAAAVFLGQEIDHTLELKAIIKQAGGKPVRPAGSYDLGQPSNKREVLLLLRRIEQAQLTAYLHAVTLLAPGRLRAAAAAIFSSEAQHVMVVRMQLGLAPIPSAFVTGKE